MKYEFVFWELCMCKIGNSKLPGFGKLSFEAKVVSRV